MTGSWPRAVACAIWLVAIAGAWSGAFAQTHPTAAAIRVVLVTAGDMPVLGGQADLSRADGRNQSRATGPDGTTWFQSVEPGSYELQLRFAGLTATAASIRVEPAEVITVRAVLAPGAPGTVLVVDRWRVGEGPSFGARVLADLPAASDPWALLETVAPFAIVDRIDGGGLGTGATALVGSRGEPWALTSVTFGDLQVKHPTPTGRLAFAADMASVSAMFVTTGLAPVEVQSPGVQVVLVPERGGATWKGAADVAFTAGGMVSSGRIGPAPPIARLESWHRTGVSGGGPVSSRDRLFVSGSATRSVQRERTLPGDLPGRENAIFAHLVRRSGRDGQIRVLAGIERVRHPFDDRRQFSDRAVSTRNAFEQAQVTWEGGSSGGAHRTLSLGIRRGAFTPDVATGALGGVVDRVRDGVVPPPPASTKDTGFNLGAAYHLAPRQIGRHGHLLRVGGHLGRVDRTATLLAFPIVAETVYGTPARVWVSQAPGASSRRRLTEAAFFVADRVSMSEALSVDIGLRVDALGGKARGAAEGVSWTVVSPRVSFRWQRGKVAAFGGFGKYLGADALGLLSFGDPGEPRVDVYRWTDPNGNLRVEDGEAGVLVARAGRHASVATISPTLRPPTVREWTVGLEWRPGARSVLRGAIIIRRQHDGVGSVNVGVPIDAYRTYQIADIGSDEGGAQDDQILTIYERLPASFGQDAFLLTNPDAARTKYDGIELTYELASERWWMLFGATAYRAIGAGGQMGAGVLENDPLVIGERFEQPNAASDEPGRLFGDRAYVGKWTGSYRAPGDLRLSVGVRYQDGQPFTRFVIAPNPAGGPEIVQAYPMGKTRFTYTGTVDARVEKGFAVGRRRLALRLDAFNLTRLRNEVEEDVVSGPDFRLSTAIQPPRTLRLGARFEF